MVLIKDNILVGPEPLVNYPKKYSTLGKLLYENLKFQEDKICMIDAKTKEILSYRELLQKSIQAAESLKLLNLTKDDVIGICCQNNINFFIPVIAATYLGLTVAPLNHSYTKSELLHCINISKPQVVFCSNAVLNKFVELSYKFTYIKQLIVLDNDLPTNSGLEYFLSLSPTVDELDKYCVESFDGSERVAYILCSSGTTGLPKGVMITHHNMLIAVGNLNDPRYYKAQDTFLAVLPLFHVFGLLTTYSSITLGSKIVVIKKFDFDQYLRTVQDYKIKHLMVVPPIVVMLAKSPLVDKYDISCVKEIGSAAAHLSKTIEVEVKKRLRLKKVEQGYGLTEITTAVLKTPNCEGTRTGSVGTVMPSLQCKIIDLVNGNSLAIGETGELCLKGPLVMKGYYGDEEATRQAIDKEGWLHTGDVAYYKVDGYFYIVGRIKELIKCKGFQVPPAELEHLLLNNPYIIDAAVIGKPHELAGELPMAFVVTAPGRNITEAQVQQFISTQVSPQKRLHGGVRFIEEIPRNPSGKILRRKLKELLQQKSKL